jgi:hypothetical protein
MRVWGLRPQRVQGRALALPKGREEKIFFFEKKKQKTFEI